MPARKKASAKKPPAKKPSPKRPYAKKLTLEKRLPATNYDHPIYISFFLAVPDFPNGEICKYFVILKNVDQGKMVLRVLTLATL